MVDLASFSQVKLWSSKLALTLALGLSLAQPVLANPADRIAELKTEIRQVAEANRDRLDNFEEIRETLSPLVKELAELQVLSPEESLKQKLGAWQQLWTDDADDTRANNIFVKVDRSRTFQVVLENGVFYNVSEVNLPFGIKFSVFLKGSYKPQDKKLDLEFTSMRLRLGGVNQVAEEVTKAEEGRLLGLVGFPGGGRVPNGPVGAQGEITTVFIDQDLRIDLGRNLADGVEDLFVLRRLAS